MLAEGRYAPLGGRERPCDVRFLAIASDDLTQRMERGVFRDDLFYRLEVLTFRLPPLRERPQDLSAICDYLLADLAGRLARPDPPRRPRRPRRPRQVPQPARRRRRP